MGIELTEGRTTESADAAEIDPEVAREAIRDSAEELERRELERAVDRLEARGTLTPAQRRTVARMATAIVDALLAAPESTLRHASACDEDAVRVAIELFDPDQ